MKKCEIASILNVIGRKTTECIIRAEILLRAKGDSVTVGKNWVCPRQAGKCHSHLTYPPLFLFVQYFRAWQHIHFHI